MRILLPALVGLALSLAGCSGQKLVQVTGKVTNHGQPLQADPGRMVLIVFVPAEKGDAYDTYPALFNNEDSTYEVQGPSGKGIPPGKYRVAVELSSPRMTLEMQGYNSTFTQASSPIVVDLQEDRELNIDLAEAFTK